MRKALQADLAAFGIVRVAAVSPKLRVADVEHNVETTLTALRTAAQHGCRFVVFPELSLTGYTCADLFLQSPLHQAVVAGLDRLARESAEIPAAFVVGLPLIVDGRLYNCAALLAAGDILGVVPKCHLPNTQEYYEERWFARGNTLVRNSIAFGSKEIPIGADLLFESANVPAFRLGIEICEDLWTVEPMSGQLALAGATVLANPSASDELLGKAEYRRSLVVQQAGRCLAAYVYAASGPSESTTDLVFSGHSMIAECGSLLAEGNRFAFRTKFTIADIDVERIEMERLRNSSFSADVPARSFRRIAFQLPAARPSRLLRKIPSHPFVPAERASRAHHCHEIFAIQSTGLQRRIEHTRSKAAVIGVSGGLDSTLALLVTSHAMQRLERENSDIVAIVMPGPGSTGRTQGNAVALSEALGCTVRTIPIHAAVAQHLSDIQHPSGLHDAAYENAQARERTQVLMDVANQAGGLVVGTGDLSELALGWCTYNGDHMSMYHVNAGVPKTLVRHLVEWCAEEVFKGPVSALLHDICATPITPELLPLNADESLAQRTEDTIGPYALHDFFLFHALRFGFSPAKIAFFAECAFDEQFSRAEILRWMAVFYTRFFANQFKRSAMPDAPKVGTIALSPRGDWRMPSDAAATCWLAACEALAQTPPQRDT